MLIGAMNHPARPLPEQIEWLGKNDFDFIDLTLEPPEAASWKIDTVNTRRMLESAGLRVIGHTAPFLPIANPVEELRLAALIELRRCVDVFHAVGARWMNVHPRSSPMHERSLMIAWNTESLRDLVAYGAKAGVGIMIENIPGIFNTAEELSELLDAIPELGLLLDVAHANLMTRVNTTKEIVGRFGHRLKHVHLSDNRGGNVDLHLPLGVGSIPIAEYVRVLQAAGYDGTLTLEVFSDDRSFLLHSRAVLRELWGAGETQLRREASAPR
jgi:sugar phosphate isomerase/epimerase